MVVLGTGAVDTYYGGQLARAGHEVTCFARGANFAAIQERGLEVRYAQYPSDRRILSCVAT